jgi:TPR repeat protein
MKRVQIVFLSTIILLFTQTGFGSSSTPENLQKNYSDSLKKAIDAYADLDYERAYQLFKPLAQSGNIYAQFGLAQIYKQGLKGLANKSQAFYWYQKAANQEYGIAQNHLGLMYEQGITVSADVSKALDLFTSSCGNGCAKGCKNLERIEKLSN